MNEDSTCHDGLPHQIANYAKKEFSFTVPEPAMNSLLQARFSIPGLHFQLELVSDAEITTCVIVRFLSSV